MTENPILFLNSWNGSKYKGWRLSLDKHKLGRLPLKVQDSTYHIYFHADIFLKLNKYLQTYIYIYPIYIYMWYTYIDIHICIFLWKHWSALFLGEDGHLDEQASSAVNSHYPCTGGHQFSKIISVINLTMLLHFLKMTSSISHDTGPWKNGMLWGLGVACDMIVTFYLV